jgi:hypothetical protein
MNVRRDELEADRRRLAHDAASGDQAASSQLLTVEHELAEVVLAEERAQLATEERERRAVEESEQKLEAEGRARRKALNELASKQTEDAVALQATFQRAMKLIRRLIERGDELSNLGIDLGRRPNTYDARRVLPDWMERQLAEVLPFDFSTGDARFALELTELLPGVAEYAPSAVSPEEKEEDDGDA